MDTLTAARVFVDIANSQSFTATAEKLNMSRPMVTRYVETLEDWLQTRLLHRTTRKISLTTAGETCLRDIENWIQDADRIKAMISPKEELKGDVRVASSMSFGFSQLMPAIKSFMAQHSHVRVDLNLEDGVTDLTEKSIDLAIRISSNPEPSLIGKPIANCESVIVASPAYLQANPSPIHVPADLARHHCLGYKNFQQHVWNLSQQDKFEPVTLDCRLSANEATVLLHAALEGAGISLQPTYLANQYIKNGQLVHLLPDWKPNDLTIYALYSSRKYLSPTVRALIDFLEAYFLKHPW